ncbi:hypothetical protein Mapa_015806 [Marchantia paleacea]|nr:hypothetical protein Mapa_015806 [Marchantia paleacea]
MDAEPCGTLRSFIVRPRDAISILSENIARRCLSLRRLCFTRSSCFASLGRKGEFREFLCHNSTTSPSDLSWWDCVLPTKLAASATFEL